MIIIIRKIHHCPQQISPTILVPHINKNFQIDDKRKKN